MWQQLSSMADLEDAKRRLFAGLRRELGCERVIQAMEKVPRESFVPSHCRHLAYEDIPLPIGYGQTISQPFIVALMTASLDLQPTDRVLEVGTGSGYQAAVLAEMAGYVVSTERIRELADAATAMLCSLGYGGRMEVVLAGDTLGCPERAPYDAIIVTAGAPRVPAELLEQMAPNGRMAIPVGSLYEQDLMKVTRTAEGYSFQSVGPCRFVPLVGKGAWEQPFQEL